MTIKELAEKLEEQITAKLGLVETVLHDIALLAIMGAKIEDKKKALAELAAELIPVEAIVRNQNEQMNKVFDWLYEQSEVKGKKK